MKIFKALALIGKGLYLRVTENREKNKDLRFRKQAIYNENFMVSCLRTQITGVINQMDESERNVDSAVVAIDVASRPYLDEAVATLHCRLIPCASEGLYILEREQQLV